MHTEMFFHYLAVRPVLGDTNRSSRAPIMTNRTEQNLSSEADSRSSSREIRLLLNPMVRSCVLRILHFTPLWSIWIQFTSKTLIFWDTFGIIFPFTPTFPSFLFHSGFRTKILCTSCLWHMFCMARISHPLFFFNYAIVNWFGVQ
jgi:hypothetical protein